MFKKRYLLLLLFSLFLVIPVVKAQEADPKVESISHPKNKKQKKADKKKAKEKAKGQKLIDKAMKNHMKIQSKAVRKRMKKNKKESSRLNHNEKRSFFQKLFGRKRKS